MNRTRLLLPLPEWVAVVANHLVEVAAPSSPAAVVLVESQAAAVRSSQAAVAAHQGQVVVGAVDHLGVID